MDMKKFITITLAFLLVGHVIAQLLEFTYDVSMNTTFVIGTPDYVVDYMLLLQPELNSTAVRSKTMYVNLAAVEAFATRGGNSTDTVKIAKREFDAEEYFWSTLATNLGVVRLLVNVTNEGEYLDKRLSLGSHGTAQCRDNVLIQWYTKLVQWRDGSFTALFIQNAYTFSVDFSSLVNNVYTVALTIASSTKLASNNKCDGREFWLDVNYNGSRRTLLVAIAPFTTASQCNTKVSEETIRYGLREHLPNIFNQNWSELCIAMANGGTWGTHVRLALWEDIVYCDVNVWNIPCHIY